MYVDLDLGDFDFRFYGHGKQSEISTNGYVTFGGQGRADGSNDAIPVGIAQRILAPFWDDLEFEAGLAGIGGFGADMGLRRAGRLWWNGISASHEHGSEGYSFEVFLMKRPTGSGFSI